MRRASGVRTADEFEREERALFDSAISRATLSITLSYPEFDARGDRNLPSLFLEDLLLSPVDGRPVRPQPRHTPAPAGPAEIRERRPARVPARKNREALAHRAGNVLAVPVPVFRREDAAAQARRRAGRKTVWISSRRATSCIPCWPSGTPRRATSSGSSKRSSRAILEEKHIQPGYHTERLRNAMLDDLRAFAARWPVAAAAASNRAWRSRSNSTSTDSIRIAGKIDRLDFAPDGSAFVTDYKYSRAQTAKGKRDDENLLQAPLYRDGGGARFRSAAGGDALCGAEGRDRARSAGMRRSPRASSNARWRRRVSAVEEIRAGRVEVGPCRTATSAASAIFAMSAAWPRRGEAAELAEGA